jgi:hypothetical protein
VLSRLAGDTADVLCRSAHALGVTTPLVGPTWTHPSTPVPPMTSFPRLIANELNTSKPYCLQSSLIVFLKTFAMSNQLQFF